MNKAEVYTFFIVHPDKGIAPGTPWEEVAESFECSICGLGKDAFEEE